MLTSLSTTARRWMRRQLFRRDLVLRVRRLRRPALMGTIRRTTPLSTTWGFDRGSPIDRYFIEQFLEAQHEAIRGDVLEVQNSAYTQRFSEQVHRAHVIDIDPANPEASIVTDLAHAIHVPSNTFDCFILTQTLQLIYDLPDAIGHAHRILRPGGVLLVTVPALSRISRGVGTDGDYWRFTTASCKRLFSQVFGDDHVTVASYGNVLTSVAFLMGMAQEELRPHELTTNDPYFPLIVTVRAVKQ